MITVLQPWSQMAPTSTNFRHIRHITDSTGRIIADVRYLEDAEQSESLDVAKLMAAAPDLRIALQSVHRVLRKQGYDISRINAALIKSGDTV